MQMNGRTTLGPRGMDKLIVDARGKATISNDGATIMKLLDVVHPAAKTLVDIAKSQVLILFTMHDNFPLSFPSLSEKNICH